MGWAQREFSHCSTFVDLFGGSGALSRFVKDARPDALVVWNDYDDFFGRLKQGERTRWLENTVCEMAREYVQRRGGRIPLGLEARIKFFLAQEDAKAPIDWNTLCARFLFSTHLRRGREEFMKQNLYLRNLPTTQQFGKEHYEGWLAGLRRIRMDFRKAYNMSKEKMGSTCFIMDPPYPDVMNDSYRGGATDRVNEDCLAICEPWVNYIYFTSSESNLNNIRQKIKSKHPEYKPLSGATMSVKNIDLSGNIRSRGEVAYVNIAR